MKRFLGILAALSLAVVLASVVLAVTVLRPRSEVVSTTLGEDSGMQTRMRTRIQITHYWSLCPPWQWWHWGRGGYRQRLTDGWQYGPFAFQEERSFHSWPAAVEEAARAVALQKLGVKKPDLDIRMKEFPSTTWHVIASAPTRKRMEMDFKLDFDEKPIIVKQ